MLQRAARAPRCGTVPGRPVWVNPLARCSNAYHSGFNNYVRSEALPGAVPKGQNSPQICPYGLYAEKLSGTAFTKMPRHENLQSWLYRIQPSITHEPFSKVDNGLLVSDFTDARTTVNPNQMRWMPRAPPQPCASGGGQDFVQSLATMAGAGEPTMRAGLAVHLYSADCNMDDKSFCNSDGDFLIVPQTGTLRIRTEFGVLVVEPTEIAVIMRGMQFSVDVEDAHCGGYVLELYGQHFSLPELGPIGSNGLANPYDFMQPEAAYEDRAVDHTIVNKFGGELFEAKLAHSPFNVVGYVGNYVPYKYDLKRFMCIHSVTYDHPDPSIYTVLTAPSDEPGVAVADFVVFPPRWMPQDHTFRPPWFHRNCMSEYMGMIWGEYDAKAAAEGGDEADSGFLPGGSSLHNCMTPHGPDNKTVQAASAADLQPEFFDKGLAFMFESSFLLKLTDYATQQAVMDQEYWTCWQGMERHFDPANRPAHADDPEGKREHLMAWREDVPKK